MRLLKTCSDLGVIIAGWSLLSLAAVVTAETLLRRFFGMSLQGVDEYGGYVLAIGSALGMSYALLMRAHIRVDVVIRFLPAPMRAIADIVAAFALLFVSFQFASAAVDVAMSSWRMGARAVSPLQTPLVIPQALWALALIGFAATSAAVCIIALQAAWRRDWRTVSRVAGSPGTDEEVAAAADDARRRNVSL